MATATDSTRTPSRRALFAHAIASGVAATQPPIFTVSAAVTALAAACDWAVDHRRWSDAASKAEHWSDERVDAEVARADAVFDRIIAEPSAGLGDIQAKARLLMTDLMEGGAEDDDCANVRLTLVVLRELIALV